MNKKYIFFTVLFLGMSFSGNYSFALVRTEPITIYEDSNPPEPQPNIARPEKQGERIDALTSGAAAALAGDKSSDVAGYYVPKSVNPALNN